MDTNSKILVTGVKGQLGYDVVRELNERGFKNVIGIDKDELDITDENKVSQYIKLYKPDVLIHNAAFTQVDKAEENIELVYKVNSLAVLYLAKACKKCHTIMMYISTDYVFDGKGDCFFEIYDKKNGLSIYGKSKSVGEDYIISTLDKYFIIRISWVFGKNGSNFVKTMLKLSEVKNKLDIVCDQIGSPTYTYDLSKLMCDMIMTNKYGIYHATNDGICSWSEFAREIFKLTNKNIIVNDITTDEYVKMYPKSARRPLNSRLSKKSLIDNGFNLLPSWQDALKRYLKEIL